MYQRRPDTDVDFLVEFEPDGPRPQRISKTLGRKVDVVEVRRPSQAAERIRHEAVPL